jgi:hypothetical protein
MLTPPFVSLSLRQDFPEARAALVAALWADGLEVQAETEWQRVNDPRYADKRWLREVLQPRSNSRSPIVTPYLSSGGDGVAASERPTLRRQAVAA